MRLHDAGSSLAEIAPRWGVRPQRVERLLEQHGDPVQVEGRRLDRIPNAPIPEHRRVGRRIHVGAASA